MSLDSTRRGFKIILNLAICTLIFSSMSFGDETKPKNNTITASLKECAQLFIVKKPAMLVKFIANLHERTSNNLQSKKFQKLASEVKVEPNKILVLVDFLSRLSSKDAQRLMPELVELVTSNVDIAGVGGELIYVKLPEFREELTQMLFERALNHSDLSVRKLSAEVLSEVGQASLSDLAELVTTALKIAKTEQAALNAIEILYPFGRLMAYRFLSGKPKSELLEHAEFSESEIVEMVQAMFRIMEIHSGVRSEAASMIVLMTAGNGHILLESNVQSQNLSVPIDVGFLHGHEIRFRELYKLAKRVLKEQIRLFSPPAEIVINLKEVSDPDSKVKEVSLLFYKGPKLSESEQSSYSSPKLKSDSIQFFYNEVNGVGAIVSLYGKQIKSLKDFVPEGSELLGGTRYVVKDNKLTHHLNSRFLPDVDGRKVESSNFRVNIVY